MNSKKKSSKPDTTQKYKFKVEDFRELLEKQSKKCYLTGRELSPENTYAEHIVPLGKGGEHSRENIVLIIEMLSKLKRYYTTEEIINMAYDLLSYRGGEYGIKISRR